MIQERYWEPHIPRADGRMPTSLVRVGATHTMGAARLQ